MDNRGFLEKLATLKLTGVERAIAVLWYLTDVAGAEAATVPEIATLIEQGGFGQQNRTRLKHGLEQDKRVTKNRAGNFRLHAAQLAASRLRYQDLVGVRPVPILHTVLSFDLFANSRGYVQKVALQVNAAYEYSLFDCCTVMARRLLETLIIEVFEHNNRADELKGPDGNYLMFSGLLSHVEKDQSLGLSRNARKGLADFKKLGDLSAHNRRFNATKSDIDRVQSGIRVASEELLHLCGQGPAAVRPA